MINDKTVKKYTTSNGIDVFKIPVEAFPNHVTNCYLVMDEKITLIDTGSGWDSANRDLVDGFDTVNSEFGNMTRPEDLGPVLSREECSGEIFEVPVHFPLVTPGHRKKLLEESRQTGFHEVASVIDPTAVVASTSSIGAGTHVNAAAVVSCPANRKVST